MGEPTGFEGRPKHTYIPSTLSDLNDVVIAMTGEAPRFQDDTGYFPDRSIETRFIQVTGALDLVRDKLGEESYAAAMERAERAKALFAADPNDENGKTDEGIKLLYEIEDIIQAAQKRRVKAQLPDDEGEITGD